MRTGLVLGCAAILCAALAACGSSAKASSSSSSSSSKGSSSAEGVRAVVTAHGSPRFAAVRECLAKNGVKLPPRPGGAPGQGGLFLRRGAAGGPSGGPVPGGAPAPGGGPVPGAGRAPFLRLSGSQRAKFQATLKKCGAPSGLHRFGALFGHVRAMLGSPAFKQALAKFAACMSRNGVKLPTPDTSGKGPVFDTGNVNTANAQFHSAQRKCRGLLEAAGFPGSPAAPAGSPPGLAGAPPGPSGAMPAPGGAPPAAAK